MEISKEEIETIHTNIRHNITTLLELSELKTPRKLSFLIGKEERYMARVLSEDTGLTFDTVYKISKIFNVSIDSLCINDKDFVCLYKDKISELVNRANTVWNEYINNQST